MKFKFSALNPLDVAFGLFLIERQSFPSSSFSLDRSPLLGRCWPVKQSRERPKENIFERQKTDQTKTFKYRLEYKSDLEKPTEIFWKETEDTILMDVSTKMFLFCQKVFSEIFYFFKNYHFYLIMFFFHFDQFWPIFQIDPSHPPLTPFDPSHGDPYRVKIPC